MQIFREDIGQVLTFLMNVGYLDVKKWKNHSQDYLVPTPTLSIDDEKTGSKNVIQNTSTTVSEVEVQVLPAVPIKNNKMIFPREYIPVSYTTGYQNFKSLSRETKKIP